MKRSAAPIGSHLMCLRFIRFPCGELTLSCQPPCPPRLTWASQSLEPTARSPVGLKSSLTLNQVNNQDDERNYEQEMDQAAPNVADKAKEPEHDQDNNYSPQHG